MHWVSPTYLPIYKVAPRMSYRLSKWNPKFQGKKISLQRLNLEISNLIYSLDILRVTSLAWVKGHLDIARVETTHSWVLYEYGFFGLCQFENVCTHIIQNLILKFILLLLNCQTLSFSRKTGLFKVWIYHSNLPINRCKFNLHFNKHWGHKYNLKLLHYDMNKILSI